MAIEEELTGSTVGRVQGDLVNGSSVVIDHNHPLYLSSSDVPGALSVGIQLIGMENYTLWSRAMEIALLGQNKVGFIDGSVLRTDFDGALKKIWDRCSAIVWLDLKERFDKNLWDEYDSILPPPSCDCNKAKDYVEQMQYQRLLQFLMEHTRAECNKLKKCDYCNATGHVKDDCFQLIGYPENFKGKKKMEDHMGEQLTHDQLLQMMNKSSLTQLNQILNVLQDNNNTINTQKSAHMDLLSGKVKGIGKVEDGLYVLNWNTKQHQNRIKSLSAMGSGERDLELWHKRLGHVPMGVLRRIKDFNTCSNFAIEQCMVCPQARQTRVSFPMMTHYSR
ncbi:hypothetical protein KY284_029932 [Solanum tuberosum]|nr:hypothetical protein KY284_029932 [Solanum tuberosum]